MRVRLSSSIQSHVKVAGICLLWYIVSSANSIVNKITLTSYPYPNTLALFSLMSIPVYSIPLLRLWEQQRVVLSPHQFNKYLVPISLGKALAVASAQFSLWKMPVSYTHTVKASMPLFAVVLARLVLRERQSLRVYLSLLPIVAGVVIASLTELSFSAIGLCSALFSTFVYSLLNIWVKKVLKESGMHPIRLLSLTSQLAAVVFFPFWMWRDAVAMWGAGGDEVDALPVPDLHMLCLLLLSGLFSFAQNVCAFSLIHELTALSYAVANATKRVTVIGASLLTLHNPVTAPNVFGMSLAVFGVFAYNRAKQSEKSKSDEQSLPMISRNNHTLSDATLVSMDRSSIGEADAMYWAANAPYKANGGSRLEGLDGYRQVHRYDDLSKDGGVRRARFA